MESKTSTSLSNATVIQSKVDPIDYDMWSVLHSITNLQQAHIVIGVFLLMDSLFFGICHFLPQTNEDKIEEQKEKKPMDKSSFKCFKILFISVLTVLVFVANGINFAYGNFITKFAVNSKLELDTMQGARTTSYFFGASVAMKLFSIFLLKIFKQIHILIFNILILMVASVMLMTTGQDNVIVFQVGSVLAGIGISTLFSIGVPWAKDQCTFNETCLILSTSVGAQVVKIPVTAWVEEFPMVLMITLFGCSTSILILAIFALALVVIAEYKSGRQDFNHNPIQSESPQVEDELNLANIMEIQTELDDEELSEQSNLTETS